MNPVGQAIAVSPGVPSRNWIESPGYDLTFFILVPLLTLPIVLLELLGLRYMIVLGFMLAFAHYLSTFTFFFWDENRTYYKTRWLAFFGGPLLLIVLYSTIVTFRIPLVVPFLILTWNTYHVARQSCGILSIYRHRAGVADPRQKEIANTAIIATCGWLTLWNVDTNPEVWTVLTAVSPRFPTALSLGFGAVAIGALLRLGVALWKRGAIGAAPRGPELAFLLTSLLLFHPYLWADSAGATYAMLLPHYVQYLGLVWMLHRRKFTEPRGSFGQLCLQRLSANTTTLVASLFGTCVCLFLVKLALIKTGHAPTFETFYLLVAFLHFYLDALFWAFKDPHVRRSLAPYLMRRAVLAK